MATKSLPETPTPLSKLGKGSSDSAGAFKPRTLGKTGGEGGNTHGNPYPIESMFMTSPHCKTMHDVVMATPGGLLYSTLFYRRWISKMFDKSPVATFP